MKTLLSTIVSVGIWLACCLQAAPLAAQSSPYAQALEKIFQAERQADTALTLAAMNLDRLPPEIGRLRLLKTLNLENNFLQSLPPELGELQALEALYLSKNRLTRLPPEIVRLTSLRTLGLQGNLLEDLPADMNRLTNLAVLNLQSNRFRHWPAVLGKLPGLQYLYLANNMLAPLPQPLLKKVEADQLYLELRQPNAAALEQNWGKRGLAMSFSEAQETLGVPDALAPQISAPGQRPFTPADEVFKVAEVMPSFPGCTHTWDQAAHTACNHRRVEDYLKSRLQYRPAQWNRQMNYTARFGFYVAPEGVMYNIVVSQAPDEASRAALQTALEHMAAEITWEPGRQRGRLVTCMYSQAVDLRRLLGK